MSGEAEYLFVRRQWNDWRIAKYRFEDVSGIHWDDVSGGIQARAPRAFLHGYVFCDGMIEGELSHSCAHGKGPHNIKVCIVKKDNDKAIFERAVEAAGARTELDNQTNKDQAMEKDKKAETRRGSLSEITGMFHESNMRNAPNNLHLALSGVRLARESLQAQLPDRFGPKTRAALKQQCETIVSDAQLIIAICDGHKEGRVKK